MTWTTQQSNVCTIQVFSEGSKQETLPVDGKAFYLFGREAETADIVLTGPGASRTHAALVHHEDGKTYLIDLQSVRSAMPPYRVLSRAGSSVLIKRCLMCRLTGHSSKIEKYPQTNQLCLLIKPPSPLVPHSKSIFSVVK